jgi:hypothetical protein
MPSRRQGIQISPQSESAFEYVVRRLRLSPSDYATSPELKAWVRGNKDQRYVPPELLSAWGFAIDEFGIGNKKRAA